MKTIALASVLFAGVCVARPAVAVDSFTVDIVRTDGGGALGWNGSLTYEIRGILTNQSNDGLAFFTYDLRVVGPSSINLSAAIVQSGGPAMSTFEQPLGYSVDFDGTAVGNELHQAGGAQNVIDNDPNASPFAVGNRLGTSAMGRVWFCTRGRSLSLRGQATGYIPYNHRELAYREGA